MKKIWIVTACVALLAVAESCKNKRNPGRVYMPDMAYSRAYETYSPTGNLQKEGINYNAKPVDGTVARGEMPAYSLKNDSAGYANSSAVVNPLPALNATEYMEAARLYLVNCGICHGEKLDGNGPLWKGGEGPFPAAPKNLMGDDMKAMKEGTMFHSVTYGQGQMGSYASQLSTKQRWMIIHYIKEKQGLNGSVNVVTKDPTAIVKDTAAKK